MTRSVFCLFSSRSLPAAPAAPAAEMAAPLGAPSRVPGALAADVRKPERCAAAGFKVAGGAAGCLGSAGDGADRGRMDVDCGCPCDTQKSIAFFVYFFLCEALLLFSIIFHSL